MVNHRAWLTPGRVLFVLIFFVQFVDGLYVIRQIDSPLVYDVMSRIAVVWVIWWWLMDDSRRLGVTWFHDLGMFLFIAWIFILPYHLFKTRGFRAFIPILAFILTALCGSVAAAVFSVLLY